MGKGSALGGGGGGGERNIVETEILWFIYDARFYPLWCFFCCFLLFFSSSST